MSMTPEQQAALVMSRIACANIEIAAMQLQNTIDLKNGMMPWLHLPQDYTKVIDKYQISPQAVMMFFEGVQ